MIKSEKEIHELFFDMEKKFNFFELRTEDDFPVWDIIRLTVWLNINFSKVYGVQYESKISFLTRIERLLFTFKSILIFFKVFMMKADNFHYGYSRIKNKKHESYDPYFDSIKNIVPGKFIFYETWLYKPKYSNDSRIFDILPLYKKILKNLPGYMQKRQKLNGKHIPYILSAIHESFENVNISNVAIEDIVNDFRIEFHFYKWIFKFKKIKRIFIFNSGAKSIFHAAKVNNIPSFEFQHGDIVNASIVYNYGHPENNKNNNIIYPDVLLTFSNIWIRNKYIPSKCIEIGTDFFNNKIIKGNQENSITVIASKEHNAYLEKLAFDLANKDKTVTIYYKLHPGQYPLIETQIAYFNTLPNVTVISTEKNMRDMMEMSDEFIAVYSTALYEVLQAGKTVYIYKQLNYRSFKDYFDFKGVYLFNNADELLEIRKEKDTDHSKSSLPQLFKPFNKESLLNAINSIK